MNRLKCLLLESVGMVGAQKVLTIAFANRCGKTEMRRE